MKKPLAPVDLEEAEPEEAEPEEAEEAEPEEAEEAEPEVEPETPEPPKQEIPEWQTRLSKVEEDVNELKQAARRKVRHVRKSESPTPEAQTPKPKHPTIQSKRLLGKLFKSKKPAA